MSTSCLENLFLQKTSFGIFYVVRFERGLQILGLIVTRIMFYVYLSNTELEEGTSLARVLHICALAPAILSKRIFYVHHKSKYLLR